MAHCGPALRLARSCADVAGRHDWISADVARRCCNFSIRLGGGAGWLSISEVLLAGLFRQDFLRSLRVSLSRAAALPPSSYPIPLWAQLDAFLAIRPGDNVLASHGFLSMVGKPLPAFEARQIHLHSFWR